VSIFDAVRTTAIWRAVDDLPASLERTLAGANALDAAAAALAPSSRVLVAGNGASHYAGVALWLASLEGPVEVQAVSAGLLGRLSCRPGDATVAVSVSGEFRDLVESLERLPRPLVAITAAPESTLARHADVVVPLGVADYGTETHPQDFCNATLGCLALLARLAGNRELRSLVDSVPGLVAATVDGVADWLERPPQPVAVVGAGHATAGAGALELALLVKEIARVPAEGLETREAATSALTGMHEGCLAVGLASHGDPFLAETERLWSRSGASILRIPFGADVDPRAVPIVSFPAGAALAVVLAQAARLDPDRPWWVPAYFSTARMTHVASR
jgi:D-arabinose 5-phosphate isomerase GutQ